MGKSLVALDTDHIKGYVFETDKLREIRGASSLLDLLNRLRMQRLASKFGATCIYANGGSGLFVVDSDNAVKFGESVQKEYSERTQGTASISCAIQAVPDLPLEALLKENIPNELELLRWRLQGAKSCPRNFVTLPSHPFMKPCDSCGIEYAEDKDTTEDRDDDEQDRRYCHSCLTKRNEDVKVKKHITHVIRRLKEQGIKPKEISLWDRLIAELHRIGYELPVGTERPRDFNDFRGFSEAGAKDYLGLIYADANGMGKKLEDLQKLADLKDFARIVDEGVYKALASAIKEYLPVKDVDGTLTFPFDVLLVGGDDIVIVTHASVAMQVAVTLAQEFHDWTKLQQQGKKGYTLSVGVVLAPVKYPFGLLLDLVEDILKSSKKKGSSMKPDKDYGDTCINFMAVTGSTSQKVEKVESFLQRKKEKPSTHPIFYATLRPYTLQQMQSLLALIEEGGQKKLGRTKLHQMREAVLEKNLTTSVVEGISVLRNWKEQQRGFVIRKVYRLGRPDVVEPEAIKSMQVIFPWYADGYEVFEDTERPVYRTPLLDFVELYDFVAKGDSPSEAKS